MKYAGLRGNKNARKAAEKRRCKMIVIPVTEQQHADAKRRAGKTPLAKWCRKKLFGA
jgi:hypothetical protein